MQASMRVTYMPTQQAQNFSPNPEPLQAAGNICARSLKTVSVSLIDNSKVKTHQSWTSVLGHCHYNIKPTWRLLRKSQEIAFITWEKGTIDGGSRKRRFHAPLGPGSTPGPGPVCASGFQSILASTGFFSPPSSFLLHLNLDIFNQSVPDNYFGLSASTYKWQLIWHCTLIPLHSLEDTSRITKTSIYFIYLFIKGGEIPCPRLSTTLEFLARFLWADGICGLQKICLQLRFSSLIEDFKHKPKRYPSLHMTVWSWSMVFTMCPRKGGCRKVPTDTGLHTKAF